MFWKNNPDLLKLLLARCDEITAIAKANSQEHRTLADLWGKTHISLGLFTILFSSISAVFAFSSAQIVVIASSLISTVLASCITFLNPSQREMKRRNYFSMLKNIARLLILIGMAHGQAVLASEAAQVAICNYYQGDKVIKNDPSCIVYTMIDKGIYQGKIFWQDEKTITRFSGNFNTSLTNALVDERPVTRQDQGLGAYCFNFLDNGDRLCIQFKN